MAVPIGFVRRWAKGSESKRLLALLDFVGMNDEEKREWLEKAKAKLEAEKKGDE